MEKIITEYDLRAAILQLESRQTEEGKLMKEQFLVAVESIKPINLIKNTLREAVGSEDLQDNVLNSSLGFSAGYISKILFQGATSSPLKKIIGTALMFGIKNLIAQNPEIVKSGGRAIFNFVRNILSEKDKKAHNEETVETTIP
jgi:hypothetical protein